MTAASSAYPGPEAVPPSDSGRSAEGEQGTRRSRRRRRTASVPAESAFATLSHDAAEAIEPSISPAQETRPALAEEGFRTDTLTLPPLTDEPASAAERADFAPGFRRRKRSDRALRTGFLLGAACALVVGIYYFHSGMTPAGDANQSRPDAETAAGGPAPAVAASKPATAASAAEAQPARSLEATTPAASPAAAQSDEVASAAPTATDPQTAAIDDYSLGVRYAVGDGVPQDYGKAAELFLKSAAQGLAKAQYNLGALYASGLGVPKDPPRAVNWYQSAARQRHPLAELNLALAYANGTGVDRDDAEAARWLLLAAQQGVVNAQFDLAVLYVDGRGVHRSLPDAYAWFSIAAAGGDAESREQMKELEARMSARDIQLARERATKLADTLTRLKAAGG